MSQLHISDSTTHGPCVCVQDSFRERVCNEQQNRESQEGDVCGNAYTPILPKLVSLVSSVVVLLWYQTNQPTYTCGTKSGTTESVVS